MLELVSTLVAIVAGVILIYGLVWLVFFLPADMARERGRAPFVWVLISIVGNPLLAILLLAALGDANT